jgi:hypothetical protein
VGLAYHQLLRAMDRLETVQSEVEVRISWQLVSLLRFDLTLVFVDLTSVSSEGQGQSPLWQCGASKDGKPQNQ